MSRAIFGTDLHIEPIVTTFTRVLDEDGDYTGRHYGKRPGRGNVRRRAIGASLATR